MRLRAATLLAAGALFATAGLGRCEVLTASDAVRETLARDPKIALALAQAAEREGQFFESRGLFDPAFFFDSQLDFRRQELAGEVLKEESKRRIQLELVDRFFTNAAEDIDRFLADGDIDESSLLFGDTSQRTADGCGPTQTKVEIDLGADIEGNEQGTIFLCLNAAENFGSVQSIAVSFGEYIDENGTNHGPISLESLSTLRIFLRLSQIAPELQEFQQELIKLLNDQGRIALRIVRQVAEAARFARARLGRLPDEQESIDFQTSFGTRHRFRNGIGLTPTLELRATEENFSGKLRIVQFGDSTTSNLFTATARLAFDFPLGKNRGRAAVQAGERAAEANVRAARALAVQTASDQALETLRAYWQLAAAQESEKELERSLAIRRQIDRAVGDLIEGHEMPAVERKRSSAQVAQVQAQLAQARQQVATARLELARAIGLAGETPQVADLSAEPLAPYVELPALDGAAAASAVEKAMARRADLAANDSFVEANRLLQEAARRNLRPDVTLALNVSFSGLEESFEDRFYDAEGFWKAASGKTVGPSYGIALRFALPFGNNEARGRLLQAESNLDSAEIERVDLARTIGIKVHQAVAALDRARRELEQRASNLENQRKALESSLELLKAGDITVIDTLTTEDQLTQSTLAWIEAARAYAELQTQIRYETNTLLGEPSFDANPRALELRPFDEPVL